MIESTPFCIALIDIFAEYGHLSTLRKTTSAATGTRTHWRIGVRPIPNSVGIASVCHACSAKIRGI